MDNSKKIASLLEEIKKLELQQKATKKDNIVDLREKLDKTEEQLAVAIEALHFMKQFRQLSKEVYITANRALEKIEGMK